ncbi:MAG: YbaN family protein [Acidimicrobiia bacterium]
MRRVGLLALGWTAVALGGIGIVLPVLPSTGFFVLAAACFARSSPRFERWVLNLPKVGPLVRDHRAGLGMPRRVKLVAIGMMLTACTISAVTVGHPVVAAVVLGLGGVGTWYVGWRVPTRERVLAARRSPSSATGPTRATPPSTA